MPAVKKNSNANLFSLLKEQFPIDRSKPCLTTVQGDSFSYDDLLRSSARVAGVLTGKGVVAGDRVMMHVDKTPQALFLYLACLQIGAIIVPLNTAYQLTELEYFVSDAQPRLAVCGQGSALLSCDFADNRADLQLLTLDDEGKGSLMDLMADLPAIEVDWHNNGDDVAAILYTSGTTGKPKGAMLTHNNLYSNAQALTAAWGITSSDVLLHALPIFHTHGLFVAFNSVLLSGASFIFLRNFNTEQVLDLLPRATLLMGVPTFYTRLLNSPRLDAERCSNVRVFISGSAPLLEQTWEDFYQRTGHKILERYGMTETGMNTSNPLHGERIASTVGQALPGIEVRVCDSTDQVLTTGEIGDIQVRGQNVFKGYWKKPEKTRQEFTKDGFFKTGDVGTLDERGYLAIVGRSKDLVISGGYNVYPKEIESLLDRFDGVVESAVIGVPHTDFGEAVVALIVTSVDTSESGLIEGLQHYLAQHLAAYKRPKRIIQIAALPRNVMGKVEKNTLRERYTALFD